MKKYFPSLLASWLMIACITRAQENPDTDQRFDLTNAPAFVSQMLEEVQVPMWGSSSWKEENEEMGTGARISLTLQAPGFREVPGVPGGLPDVRLNLEFYFEETVESAEQVKLNVVTLPTRADLEWYRTVTDGSMPGDEANFQTFEGTRTSLVFRRGTVVVSVLAQTNESEKWLKIAFAIDRQLQDKGAKATLEQLMSMFPADEAEPTETEQAPPVSDEIPKSPEDQFKELVDSLNEYPTPPPLDENATQMAKDKSHVLHNERGGIIYKILELNLNLPESKKLLTSLAEDTWESPYGRSFAIRALQNIDESAAVSSAYKILKEIPPQRELDDLDVTGRPALRTACLRVVFQSEKLERSIPFFKEILRNLEKEGEDTRTEFSENIPLLLQQSTGR